MKEYPSPYSNKIEISPIPKNIKKSALSIQPNKCFDNSRNLALANQSVKIIEGVILLTTHDGAGKIIAHVWNKYGDKYFDATLDTLSTHKEIESIEYFPGIEFDIEDFTGQEKWRFQKITLITVDSLNRKINKDYLLYSYCIPMDDGAAPNPFWDVCTLAICKPVIRRTAKVGDWIVATGSKALGLENKVVYAMRVTDIKSFEEYDFYCKTHLKNKLPDPSNADIRRRAGDCIYHAVNGKLVQRKGAHDIDNQPVDERGKNVLLSQHFFYFGKEAVSLPKSLESIVKQGQGHRSRSNISFADEFIDWINGDEELTLPFLNEIKSNPQMLCEVFSQKEIPRCSSDRREEGEEDENCSHLC